DSRARVSLLGLGESAGLGRAGISGDGATWRDHRSARGRFGRQPVGVVCASAFGRPAGVGRAFRGRMPAGGRRRANMLTASEGPQVTTPAANEGRATTRALMALAAALQFLTRIPALVRRPFTAMEMGDAVACFPAVGLLLGAALAGLDLLLG